MNLIENLGFFNAIFLKERFLKHSCVPIKQAGPIKRAGRNFQNTFKNKQALLSEQAGIFMMILKMSRLIPKIFRAKWEAIFIKLIITQ